MRFGTRRSSLRPRPSVPLAALAALVILVTGFEAATHGHVPALAGWHDASPHGAAVHDDGLKSCSICRLAHESSPAPLAPLHMTRPDRVVVLASPASEARSLAVLARERSPRAPPRTAAC